MKELWAKSFYYWWWQLVRSALLGCWVVPVAKVIADAQTGRFEPGTLLSALYSLGVLLMGNIGSTSIRLSATADFNAHLVTMYLIRFLATAGLEAVWVLPYLMGLALRWSALWVLRWRVTWDRLDWRGGVNSGIYRYLDHPMTIGMVFYTLALGPGADVEGWARRAIAYASIAGIYWIEATWLKSLPREIFETTPLASVKPCPSSGAAPKG